MLRVPVKKKLVHLSGLIFVCPIVWLRPWQTIILLSLIIGFSRIFLRFTAYGMISVCLLLLLSHNREVASAAWLTLILGDGMSTLCGIAWGGPSWSWNRRKTLIGSLAFLVSTVGGLSVLFILIFHHDVARSVVVAFACASGAAIMESLPLSVNDNLTVVLVAGMLSWLGTFALGW